MKNIYIKKLFNLLNFFIILLFLSPSLVMSEIINDFSNDYRNAGPIADRWIEANTATNPISFTVSDREGGPLYIECTSSNIKLVPDSNENIIIASQGKTFKVHANPGEKIRLSARIIPVENETGVTKIKFKVTDSGGLSASKSFDLTVVTAEEIPDLIKNKEINYVGLLDVRSFLTKEQELDLTITGKGNGKVSILGKEYSLPFDSSFRYNDLVKPIAIADDGWKFIYWTGDIIDTINPIEFEMKKSTIISAIFVADEQNDDLISTAWDTFIFIKGNEPVSQLRDFVKIGEDNEILTEPDDNNEQNILSIISDVESNNYFKTQIQDINQNENKWFIAIKPFSQSIDTNLSFTLSWDFSSIENKVFELNKLNDDGSKDLLIDDMSMVNKFEIQANKEIQIFILKQVD